MAAADRLIVALDLPTIYENGQLFANLLHRAGVRFFKLGVASLMDPACQSLVNNITNLYKQRPDDQTAQVMFDLKLYDTRDTVRRTVAESFARGASFLTVYPMPSIMEHAMKVKPPDKKIIAVPHLSDQTSKSTLSQTYILNRCDGVVCPPAYVPQWLNKEGKILICPGIRPTGHAADNHAAPTSPAEAIRNGADYLVVGRPIYAARDPVFAAKSIIREIEETENASDF